MITEDDIFIGGGGAGKSSLLVKFTSLRFKFA